MSAARYVLQRMQRDPRLASLLGFGTEAFERLTAEVAALDGIDVDAFRARLELTLRYEKWPSEDDIQERIDEAVANARPYPA